MMMAAFIKKLLPFHNVLCIYSNTGCENDETLDFIHKCDIAFGLNVVWIEAVTHPEHGKGVTHRVTDYTNAYRSHQYKDPKHPFHAHIAKNGIPNMARPHCSDRLKEHAIEHYKKVNNLKGCSHSLGMRSDEPNRTMPKNIRKLLAETDMTPDMFKRMEHQHRINGFTSSGYDYTDKELSTLTNYSKKLERYNLVYVLADAWRADKQDVNTFWEMMPFRLMLKDYEGNCQTCWKKSETKLKLLATEKPMLFEAFDWFEKTYAHVKPLSIGNYFFRGMKSAAMILGEADALDKFMLQKLSSRDNDSNEGCGSSCESYLLV